MTKDPKTANKPTRAKTWVFFISLIESKAKNNKEIAKLTQPALEVVRIIKKTEKPVRAKNIDFKNIFLIFRNKFKSMGMIKSKNPAIWLYQKNDPENGFPEFRSPSTTKLK